MAKMYKTFSFQPSLADESGNSKVCENLRRAPDGSLTAAYPPGVMIEGCRAWKFLGCYTLSDGSGATVMANGCDIGVRREDYVMQVATLPAEPLCINFEGDDVVISTERGICRMYRTVNDDTHDETWNCTMPTGEYPGLHFSTIDRGEVTVPTGGLTFAKPYEAWGGSLATADIKNISEALKEAYMRLTRTIADAGDFTQPVAVRYKLRDRQGRLLFTGPVTVLSAQGGWQGMDSMTSHVHTDSSGNFYHADSFDLTLRRFTLAIDLPGYNADYVAPTDGVYAEVYVLPQLHPLDTSTNAEYRMSAAPGEETLTVWLPGPTLGRSPLTSRLTRSMANAPAYMGQHEVKIATINHPFALRPRRVEIPIPDTCEELHREASDDNAAWKAMTYTPATDSELSGLRLTSPNSFSAGCVCRSGRNVVWGRIRREPFKGFDLNLLSVGDVAVSIKRASIRVTLTDIDGSTIQTVRNMAADTASDSLFLASDTLSPMIMYPDPSASLIEMRIERQDGYVAETSIALTPSADRRYAFNLTPSAEPRTLTYTADTSFTPFTADNSSTKTMPSTIGIADAADSVNILGAAECCQGMISQIIPAWGANSSWDYASGRFYILSSAGIYGLAADITALNRLKSSLIDPRSTVLSRGAVMTPHGVAAIAGGDLLLLSGTRGQTLLRNVTASSLGYSGRHDELWLPDTYGVTVYPMQHREGTYRRPSLNIRSIIQAGTEILIIDDAGRMCVSSTEDTLADVTVKWEGYIPHPVSAPACLVMDMEGGNVDLSASLSSHSLAVSRLHIRGDIHHATAMRILGPVRTSHSLCIEGTVRGDSFTLRQITLRLDDRSPVSGFL